MSSVVGKEENQNEQNIPSGNNHPIYNPLILESIMKWCSLQDIKSFRQVSKLWHSSSTKSFGVIGVVGTKLRGKGMEQFVKFLEQNENVNREIYRNFTLRKLNSDVMQKESLFWNNCGSHIKILKLAHVEFQSANEFRYIAFGMCTNLKKLHIKDVKVKTDQIQESSIQFPQSNLKFLTVILTDDVSKTTPVAGNTWMEIFTCVPFLKSLTLDAEGWDDEVQKIADDAFNAIKIIRQENPNKLRLTHMDPSGTANAPLTFPRLSPALLQVLLDPKLHFERLQLELYSVPEEDTRRLAEILRAIKNSIRVFELENYNYQTVICMEDVFPISQNPDDRSFKFLTEISMYGIMFSSLAFLNFTPNLRKLSLNSIGDMIIENTSQSELQDLKCLKCVELDLYLTSCPMSEKRVKLFIDLFPNLEILQVPLNNASFSLVCRHLPNLVSLTIFGGKLDECGLVGLDKEQVDMINAEQENWSQKLSTVRRANVTSLKYLRKLIIWDGRGNNFQQLSYSAITLGIKQCHNLENLYLPKPGPSKAVVRQNLVGSFGD